MLLLLQRLARRSVDGAQFGVDPCAGVLLAERSLLDVGDPQLAFSERRVAELDEQLAAGGADPVTLRRSRSDHLQRRLLLARAVVPPRRRVALVELVADEGEVLGARELHLETTRLVADVGEVLGARELHLETAGLQSLHRVQVYTAPASDILSTCYR